MAMVSSLGLCVLIFARFVVLTATNTSTPASPHAKNSRGF
jgi:hypothetical protein